MRSVGFCARQSTLTAMLESMVGLDGEAPDELTAFTRPLTGADDVIPCADDLAALSDGEPAD